MIPVLHRSSCATNRVRFIVSCDPWAKDQIAVILDGGKTAQRWDFYECCRV
jgi:hypothetical protein